MPTDDERREVARRLREYVDLPDDWWADTYSGFYVEKCAFGNVERHRESELFARLADLIEPSYKPDVEYETWYNGLSRFGDERGGPSTIRQLIEEIVWTALTVDLGPNGNTDSTGVDEGRVYTDNLFAEWEREALRLSGSIDRDALLALAGNLDKDAVNIISAARNAQFTGGGPRMEEAKHDAYEWRQIARSIRKALGVADEN